MNDISLPPAVSDQCSRLANGVTLYTRKTKELTAAIGLWIRNGVRHEQAGQGGYAHLLEHLLFKGAAGRSAADLSRLFEAMGGQVNAYTGRESTVLHGFVPAADANLLTQLLCEMVCAPGFGEEDLGVEREVILQEMAMVEEDPEELLSEEAVRWVWPDHPLGRPILGDRESILRVTLPDIRAYAEQALSADRILLVAVGGVDHDAIAAAAAGLTTLRSRAARPVPPPVFRSGTVTEPRDVSQTHLSWVMPGPAIGDPLESGFAVANHLLGGGVSSRLFLEVRERLGLAYDIQSRLETYSDGGLWWIETACADAQAEACREAVERTVSELVRGGPREEEVALAKRYLEAGLILEEGDPRATLERLAREQETYGRVWSQEERKVAVRRVGAAAVARMLAQAWAQRTSFAWHPLS